MTVKSWFIWTPHRIVVEADLLSEYFHQCTVPWRDFIHHIGNESAVIENAHDVMKKALSEALPRREHMKNMQDAYSDDVLWARYQYGTVTQIIVFLSSPEYEPLAVPSSPLRVMFTSAGSLAANNLLLEVAKKCIPSRQPIAPASLSRRATSVHSAQEREALKKQSQAESIAFLQRQRGIHRDEVRDREEWLQRRVEIQQQQQQQQQ